MFRKLHTKYKLSFAIFTIAFVFFLLFVLIDDAVVKGGTALALRSLLWLRLGTAFVFSSALGGLTLFILHLTYKSLRSLTHLFQSWTQDVYEETGESERNDEIGELARSFRIALFQKKKRKRIFPTIRFYEERENFRTN